MSHPDDDLALDRTGHLSAWAFDRLRLDDPSNDVAFFTAAERHIATCDACRAARAALDAEVAALPVPLPPRLAAAPRPSPASRPARARWWLGGGAVLAAAALALVLTRTPTGDGDGIVAKGTRFDFEVYVHDGASSALATDGAVVRPGARAGFRARAAAAGYLLVWGWDDRATPYAVHPRDGSQRAVPIAASGEPAQLPAAIAFDAVGRAEHLAAAWCPAPFALADLGAATHVDAPALEAAVAARGCLLRAVHLEKRSAP